MKNIFSKNIYTYISIFIFLVVNICSATNMFDKMITYDSEMSDFYDTQLNCQIFPLCIIQKQLCYLLKMAKI